jgi:alcohol dehydrogenase (NADP+)
MPVDPKNVPYRTLFTGAKIPAIGLGTFGSDKYSPADVAKAVIGAAEVGYRHFDCASVYRNEPEVGQALSEVMKSGVDRGELWVTSKVWNDRHDDAEAACESSLRDLRLDFLDLYLIHWPFPNSHAPGVDVTSRDPHAVPYNHADYMKTWERLESLVNRGLVRHIGSSNMTIPKIALLLRDASIHPAVNEMELHPHFQQPKFFSFLKENRIQPIGYSPIGSPSRPERDRVSDDTVDIEDPVVLKIAEAHGIHPAALCVKWQVQIGSIPIPFSVKQEQYEATLEAILAPPLNLEEMEELSAIDRNCRLIKGQVFLWETAEDWHDLWDLKGAIAS